MKKFISGLFTFLFIILCVGNLSAQYKMDGKTMRNSSNSIVGKIDGKTIRNSSNSTLGKVDSNGKTIRNRSNSIVLKIDGNKIRNSSGKVVATMSDVTSDIQGAEKEAIYVALWWFIVEDND